MRCYFLRADSEDKSAKVLRTRSLGIPGFQRVLHLDIRNVCSRLLSHISVVGFVTGLWVSLPIQNRESRRESRDERERTSCTVRRALQSLEAADHVT